MFPGFYVLPTRKYKQTNKTRSDWLKNSYKQKIVETKIRSEFWNRSCISIPLLSYCKIRG